MQVVGLPTLRMSKHHDLVLGDGKLTIPRNTTIWIPLGLPHASSAVYDQPDHFLPERWLQPNAEYMPKSGTTDRKSRTVLCYYTVCTWACGCTQPILTSQKLYKGKTLCTQ